MKTDSWKNLKSKFRDSVPIKVYLEGTQLPGMVDDRVENESFYFLNSQRLFWVSRQKSVVA